MKSININFNFITNNFINDFYTFDETISYLMKTLEGIIYNDILNALFEGEVINLNGKEEVEPNGIN